MSTQVIGLRYKDNTKPSIWDITHVKLETGEMVEVAQIINGIDEGDEYHMILPNGNKQPISLAILLDKVPTDEEDAMILKRTITAGPSIQEVKH